MNDRLLKACRREPVDGTPVWFMRQAGRYIPSTAPCVTAHAARHLPHAGARAEVTLQPVQRLNVDAAILFADIPLPFGRWASRSTSSRGAVP